MNGQAVNSVGHICVAGTGCDNAPCCEAHSERVARRIHSRHVVPEEQADGSVIYRPSSAAFSDSSDGSPMSAGILSIADAEEQLKGFRKHSLVSLSVGDIAGLAESQRVCKVPNRRNPSHAYVLSLIHISEPTRPY